MKGRLVRTLGTVLIGAGVLVLMWAFVVWRWQDPATNLYTRWQQRQLTSEFHDRMEAFRPSPVPAAPDPSEWAAQVRHDANRYLADSHRGDALGRLRIPRLGVNMLLVNGTDRDSLKKGPGRYAGTPRDLDGDAAPPRAYMPGQGQRVYVAGHRTTYQAPFSHIDHLRPGDVVTLDLPYARFVYRVTGHRIVASSRLDELRSRGHEQLVLQACHPRFFATHRYLVYASPVQIRPRGSRQALPAAELVAAR